MSETSKRTKREINMLEGPIASRILMFAIPLMLTGMLQQLFNAADVAVVGRWRGANAMAAVGSNSSIVSLLVNLFVGIGVGGNVIISKYTGRRDYENVHKAVHTSVLTAVFSGILTLTVGEIAASPLLHAMSVPDEVFPMALLYLRIYFIGMPVILLYNFEAAIFESQGDTRTPLIVLTISGIMNIVLNITFVAGLGMSVDGVAWPTVLTNAFSAFVLLFLLVHHEGEIRVRRKELRIDPLIFREIIRVGLPAGIQSAVFSISNIVIQSAVNSLGSTVMAASSAAYNIEIMAYYVLNSFGQACTTFVSQNYGARNLPRCRRVIRTCIILDLVVVCALSAVLLLLDDPLLAIFNTDPQVISYGKERLHYILLFEAFNATIEIVAGAMRGFGRSLTPALIVLLGVCVTRIVWVITIFPVYHTFAVLMMAYPVSWIITLSILILAYLHFVHHLSTEPSL